jgi:hypothetical protein
MHIHFDKTDHTATITMRDYLIEAIQESSLSAYHHHSAHSRCERSFRH